LRGARLTMEALIDALRAEGGALAESVRTPAARRTEPGPPQKAASGPRAVGRESEYELLLEMILEGSLLHYGSPRVVQTDDPDRRRAPKSKYTLDRNIPGAYEGETITRRRLMVGAANGAGAVAAAAFTLPALAFALAPVFKTQPVTWQPLGAPSDFTKDNFAI